jgi:hypothetical protein
VKDAALNKTAAVKASIVDFFISIPLSIVELMCWLRAPEGTPSQLYPIDN